MSSTADSSARTTRPTAFLSYARGDQEHAERLATALAQAGVDVWWDTLIEGGAEFTKSIEAAINRADAVVVAWSQRAVGSDWVLDEASRGRDLHKLVPVLLDGTEPPLGFRRYQTVDLQQWLAGEDTTRSTALSQASSRPLVMMARPKHRRWFGVTPARKPPRPRAPRPPGFRAVERCVSAPVWRSAQSPVSPRGAAASCIGCSLRAATAWPCCRSRT